MQGAGSPDLGVIGVMPFTSGKVTASSIDVKNEGYRQSFSKSSEQASPGFYSMQMDNGVTVELTATPLCGHHRYTYDKSVANRVVLFLPSITILGDGRHLNVTMAFDPTALAFSGSIQVDESMSGRKPGGLPIYFSGTVAPVAPTTAKLESFGTWVDSSISVGSTFASAGSGHSVGGFLQFSAPTNTSSNLVLELKLGLSLIDVTTAKRNLQQEIGSSQSFDVTVAAARNAWRMVLQRTTPVSPTMSSLWQKRERMFYTALYVVSLCCCCCLTCGCWFVQLSCQRCTDQLYRMGCECATDLSGHGRRRAFARCRRVIYERSVDLGHSSNADASDGARFAQRLQCDCRIAVIDGMITVRPFWSFCCCCF